MLITTFAQPFFITSFSSYQLSGLSHKTEKFFTLSASISSFIMDRMKQSEEEFWETSFLTNFAILTVKPSAGVSFLMKLQTTWRRRYEKTLAQVFFYGLYVIFWNTFFTKCPRLSACGHSQMIIKVYKKRMVEKK